MKRQDTTRALIRRLFKEHLRFYWKQLALAVACMLVVAATTGATAGIIAPAIDSIFIDKNRAALLIIPLEIFAIGLTGAIANYGNIFFMRFVGQRLVADMQTRLFGHLIRSDIGLFHTHASGRLISRFTNDINLMRNAFTNVLTALAKGVCTTLFLVGVMIYQNAELTAIALFAFVFAIAPLVRLGKRMRKISDKTQQALGDFTVTLDEIFHGVRTVKSYNRELFEAKRASSNIEHLCKLYLKSARIQAAATPLMEILGAASMALVFWYGGTQFFNGTITLGNFSSFIGAFLMAYKPIRSTSGISGALQEGVAAAQRLFALLDTTPAIADAPGATPLVIHKGVIRFEQATFHYQEGGRGVEVITLEVPAGKTAALVGLSGGGKSTIMNLLLRFYDAQSGHITIDGQDIRNVTLHSLRDAIAYVPQESMLFDDTIRANIAYGKPGASEEDIIAAARNAACHEFIAQMPQSYDTLIGAHGVRLSGGQRQRISVARAMLKSAPILLLDEATSSLDNESERAIQQALSRLMQGRTTLVIAHRLSTIVNADIIYVVDGGSIVESGNHASLLGQNGRYYQLYHEASHGPA